MMGLFRNMMRKKRNMRPNRMGMLAGLAGLRDRMRPARNMMFGGRRQLNPFLGMNNLPRKNRFLPPLSELPPQPGGNRAFLDRLTDQPIDANLGPIVGRGLNPILGGSDYMPKLPVEPIQRPIDVGGPVDPAPGMGPIMTQPIANPGQPQPGVGTPPPIDYSGYLDFYNEPPVPGRIAAPVPPSGGKPLPVMPGALGMAGGGDADKSEFPDLSGDGKTTEKDILIGRGVIKMQEGGDPADKVEESFTDYQPEGLLKGTIFDYIPDGYQVSAFLQDKFSRPMPVKSDLPMIDNDADMMNIQRALQNYQEFYYSQPEALRAGLPTPDELYGDNQMSSNIDMMLQDLGAPEKKSPNPPMMFR